VQQKISFRLLYAKIILSSSSQLSSFSRLMHQMNRKHSRRGSVPIRHSPCSYPETSTVHRFQLNLLFSPVNNYLYVLHRAAPFFFSETTHPTPCGGKAKGIISPYIPILEVMQASSCKSLSRPSVFSRSARNCASTLIQAYREPLNNIDSLKFMKSLSESLHV
jgi:hypothetical protein